MAKLYLAIAGRTATGKETAYKIIKKEFAGKFTVSIHHFSDPLSEILDLLNLKKSRPNQQRLSTILRQTFGENLLSNIIFQRALADSADIVFLDGVRRNKDAEMLKILPNSFLGYIDAPMEETFKRLRKRADRPGDAEKTWEQFLKEQFAEAESMIGSLRSLADFELDNSQNDPEFKSLSSQIIEFVSGKLKSSQEGKHVA